MLQTAEGRLLLLVVIDRTSKFASVKLVDKANRITASAFLPALSAAVSYKIQIGGFVTPALTITVDQNPPIWRTLHIVAQVSRRHSS